MSLDDSNPPDPLADAVQRAVAAALVILAALGTLSLQPGPIADRPLPSAISSAPLVRHADFGATEASDDARQLADWVAATGDNAGKPFFVVDKKRAWLYVFEDSARLRESTPVVLGEAQGDDTVAGIGSRPIAEGWPEERTTPAGRFVGERGHNASGKDVVWVDYDAAVSMRRGAMAQPQERRLERMASASAADKRVSYGGINVPADFFDAHVRPAFAKQRAVIYVLPEVKSLQQVFGLLERAATLGAPPSAIAVELPGAPHPT